MFDYRHCVQNCNIHHGIGDVTFVAAQALMADPGAAMAAAGIAALAA